MKLTTGFFLRDVGGETLERDQEVKILESSTTEEDVRIRFRFVGNSLNDQVVLFCFQKKGATSFRNFYHFNAMF